MRFEFSRQCFEKSSLMKIRPMEADLFNAGGQTGRRDKTSFVDEPRAKLLKSI